MLPSEIMLALATLDPNIAIKVRTSKTWRGEPRLRNTFYISSNINKLEDGCITRKLQVAATSPDSALVAFWNDLISSDVSVGLGDTQYRWNGRQFNKTVSVGVRNG